ncbi:MAG: hypothetical protein ACERJ2_10940 [Filomicrobium sp.]
MKTPHRRAHRRIWSVLALLLPGLLIAAFVLQQSRLDKRPAVRIEPPKETSTP